MPLNLRQYNLKPNSNYNVSITMKKGDRVIDNLRSVYVSTPKYLTTSIENLSTTSTIIFDRAYSRLELTAPSVAITLPIPGKNASTSVESVGLSKISAPYAAKTKTAALAKVGKVWVKGPYVDKPLLITCVLSEPLEYTGAVTLSSSEPNLIWFNRIHNVSLNNTKTFTIELKPREMDKTIYWDARLKVWISTPLALLVGDGINPNNSLSRLSYNKYHPKKDAVPGTTEQVAGVYQDLQGLNQTLKTSVNNQDLVSQLYWDDVDETDAIRDVVYFLFRDDTGDNPRTLNSIEEWIFLNENFVSAYPTPTETYISGTYTRSSGDNLTKTVPPLEQRYLELSEPEISLTKNIYQTGKEYASLVTPTQVQVAFTVARYTKNRTTGNWSGSWLKTYTSGPYSGFPVLSNPEILSGSS